MESPLASGLKRRRSENAEIDVAVGRVEGALGREEHIITQGLLDLREVIDPTDSSYEAQKRIASDSLLSALMKLLDEDSDAVKVEVARVIAALAAHSRDATQRMIGLSQSGSVQLVEKASLNPVQSAIAEVEGLISELLTLKFSDDPEVSEAGEAALNALAAYNREAKVAVLHEAVHRLQQGEPKALEAVDSLLTGLEVRDDVQVLLDQALQPVLGFLRTGSAHEKFDALNLLGSVCEARPGAAKFLVNEGALAPVVGMLVKGDLQTRDAAAHTAWLLVRNDRRLLAPAKDALGVPGSQLVAPLLQLIRAAAEAEEAENKAVEEGDGEGSEEGEQEEEEDADLGLATRPPAVENSDDAVLLLKALSAADPEVREQLAGEPLDTSSSCSIM